MLDVDRRRCQRAPRSGARRAAARSCSSRTSRSRAARARRGARGTSRRSGSRRARDVRGLLVRRSVRWTTSSHSPGEPVAGERGVEVVRVARDQHEPPPGVQALVEEGDQARVDRVADEQRVVEVDVDVPVLEVVPVAVDERAVEPDRRPCSGRARPAAAGARRATAAGSSRPAPGAASLVPPTRGATSSSFSSPWRSSRSWKNHAPCSSRRSRSPPRGARSRGSGSTCRWRC